MLEVILGLLGGLGLFIYGMHLMSDSLQKLTLSKLKVFFEKMTSNRLKGLFVGTFVTSVIQSSSATSVIVVGLVNAGFMTFSRAVPILIGANIGTTITAQLIAFRLTAIAPFFVGAGALGYLAARKQKHKKLGLIILGFGLLFLGLGFMSSSAQPLSDYPFFRDLFLIFGENPLLGVLVGIIITVILQSSSSTIGMVIALALVGLIDLRAAIFLILGDNIGTCVTAIIASFSNGKKAGKKVALFHLMFNVLGTIIALLIIPVYMHVIPLTSGDIARQIANTHTLFNVFNAVLFLPFVPLFVKLINKILPGKDYKKKESRYLKKELIRTPPLAIEALMKELVAMVGITKGMFNKCKACLRKFDHKLYEEVMIDEDAVDQMQRQMTSYIVAVTQKELSKKEAELIPRLLHSINDVEKLGDYCQNLMNDVQKMYEDNLKFSEEADKELAILFGLLNKQIDLTSEAVRLNDKKIAEESIAVKREIYSFISKSSHKHIVRLENGQCIYDAGIQFVNMTTHMKKFSSHLNNVAQMVLYS